MTEDEGLSPEESQARFGTGVLTEDEFKSSYWEYKVSGSQRKCAI